MDTMLLVEIVGWLGTVLIALAYLLVTFDRIDGADMSYRLLNLVGAIGIGINVFAHAAWPALALQVFWAIVAIASLARSYLLRRP